MLSHSLLIALLAAVPTADAADAPSAVASAANSAAERTPGQLRHAVRAALRRQATATGAEQEQALRELAAVFCDIVASESLPPGEQHKLRTLVRGRLLRASQALERQLARAESSADRGERVSPDRAAAERAGRPRVLAQVQGNPPGRRAAGAQPRRTGRAGGFGPAGQVIGAAGTLQAQTANNARQLIELIETTIAPASWQTNGGLGTIHYFAPAQVLVIRQTDGVHGRVGQAIRGLRGN